MCAGLLLCPAQAIGVLYVRRDGVLHGPSLPDQRFVDQERSYPGVGQYAAVAIRGSNVAFQAQRRSRRGDPEQCRPRLGAVRTLPLLGSVHPYESDAAAVPAPEAVAVGDMGNYAPRGLLSRQVGGSTADQHRTEPQDQACGGFAAGHLRHGLNQVGGLRGS